VQQSLFNPLGVRIMMTVDQVLAAQKANFDTLFSLTNKAFAGVEKLVELNLTAGKAALGEAADSTKAALSVKDAQELMALQSAFLQPMAEKSMAYGRHLYDITSSTSAEFSAAFEAQTAAAQKQFAGLVETMAKNAPAGSETGVAMMKSAVAAAGNAYDAVQKAVKQATDLAEQNIASVSQQAVASTKAAAKKR
jgi:phasin family protein